MPAIYDNINSKFADGLNLHLEDAKRIDYCVGYFNLRGWGLVSEGIDSPAKNISCSWRL